MPKPKPGALRVARRRRSGRAPGSGARRGWPSRGTTATSRPPGSARPRARVLRAVRNTTAPARRSAAPPRSARGAAGIAPRRARARRGARAARRSVADQVGGGLVAGHEQQQHELDHLADRRAPSPPSCSREDRADQVVARLRGAAPRARSSHPTRISSRITPPCAGIERLAAAGAGGVVDDRCRTSA